MKIVLRIFGTIALLVALLACGGSAWRNFRDAKDVAQFETQMSGKLTEVENLKKTIDVMPEGEEKAAIQQQIDDAQAMVKEIPSASAFHIAGFVLIVLGVIAFIGGILLYMPRPAAKMVFFAAVVVSVLAYFLSPDLKSSVGGGVVNRTLAISSAIPTIIVTLFAFLVARMSAPKA